METSLPPWRSAARSSPRPGLRRISSETDQAIVAAKMGTPVPVFASLRPSARAIGVSASKDGSDAAGPLAVRTRIVYFLPMRRVLIVAFEGAQTLDVTGPAEVFAAVS